MAAQILLQSALVVWATASFLQVVHTLISPIAGALPPLAERPDDILPLARHFLPDGKRLDATAERALLAHRWPGNVRELRNTIQRAALLASSAVIGAGDLGLPTIAALSIPIAAGNGHGNVDEPDRAAIEAALQRHGGVLAQAAQDLGLSRQALYRRLERLGLRRDDSPRA